MANLETATDASRVIYLDSSQASDNLSGVVSAGEGKKTTSVLFQLQEPIVVPPHHTILVSIHSCSIPFSFYNFQTGRNTTLKFGRSNDGVITTTVDHTLTLNQGNYNIRTLIDEVIASVNTYYSKTTTTGLNVVFNPSTLKNEWIWLEDGKRLTLMFRKDQTTNFKEELGFASNNFVAGLSDATENETGYNFWMERDGTTTRIGYDDGTTSTIILSQTTPASLTPLADPLSFFSVVDVNYHIRSLYVRTNITQHSVLDSAIGCRFSNILARIPITAVSGGELQISPSDGAVHTLALKVREITFISVRLTDKDNILIDLNGLDFTIAIQFDFIETPTIEAPIDKRKTIEARQYHSWLKSQGKSKERELKEFVEMDENKKFLNV